MSSSRPSSYPTTHISDQAQAQLGDRYTTIHHAHFYPSSPDANDVKGDLRSLFADFRQELKEIRTSLIASQDITPRAPEERNSISREIPSQKPLEPVAVLERVQELVWSKSPTVLESTIDEEICQWMLIDSAFLCIDLDFDCEVERALQVAAFIFDQSKGRKLIYLFDLFTGSHNENTFISMLESLIQQEMQILSKSTFKHETISLNDAKAITSRLEDFVSLSLAILNQASQENGLLLVLEGLEIAAAASPAMKELCHTLITTIRSINAARSIQEGRIRTIVIGQGRGELFSAVNNDVQFVDCDNQF